jgi:hypothetical protein
MRRKNEEELIKLAFGDIEPQGSERAKRMLAEDAEAAKLFAGYSEIREGLKSLKTPEHQLSTERLREAILKQGLKQKSPLAGWKWTFAPLAVAAAAFLITLRMGGQPTTGTYVNLPSDQGNKPTIDSPIDFNSTSRGPIIVPGPEVVQPTAERNTERVASVVRTSGRSGANRAARSVGSSLVVFRAPALSPSDFSRSAIDGALPAGALAIDMEPSEEQPIVLIGSESDESTGANRATEVSSASNVVIGG